MDDLVLTKGANVSLRNRSGASGQQVQVVVKWSDPGGAAEVDVSALLLGSDGRVRSDADFVFYNAPSGGDGSVRLLGKRRNDDCAEDRVAVDLEALPAEIQRVIIVASLDPELNVGFGDLKDVGLTLLDSAGHAMLRFDIVGAGPETAMVMAELYLRGEEWKFRAVGQGWDSGLGGVAIDYGIIVDDRPEPHDKTATRDAYEPTSAVHNGHVDTPASDTLSPVEPDKATNPKKSADEGANHEVDPEQLEAECRSRVPNRGVQTRRRRMTAATLPPLILAEDESWQPARLFSISGVGNAGEQEKRATSCLLATMMAIRDFGRALVSRFGGPAGSIETFLEVAFTLNEHTVYPDGVIRVSRAGRVWTALLETKTGTSSLRAEQVDQYLDVAKQHGYDAVITLSNDIAPVGGAHPVTVDGRKLRNVALFHISWSEVLHEAQMQLAHRGLDDRLQAWVLAELIRYLEHPRSGAVGFDDMGAAWVPVREAVAAGTLRATDRKIGAVAMSWEKLVRHLSLRLTSQLGVTVTSVLPRKVDHAARSQAAIARLASDGTLQTTLRVPGAAGLLDVVADLRTGQVRTSTEIDAPREGTSSRRVNWVIRQLAEAPDALTVEVLFARREQTSCELLKDVRTSNAALLPDPSAEVRAFRLTSSMPLGTRRNGLRKAFIPSVNAAVDAFYSQVVQGLRPWPISAPKLPPEIAEEAAETVDQLSGGPGGPGPER